MLPFIVVLLIVLAFYYLLRKKPLDNVIEQPFADFKAILSAHVEFYQQLNDIAKTRFEKQVSDFLHDVRIEGVGTDITDTDRVLIAASAVIPIFGSHNWHYKNLSNIILYPDTFDHEFQFEGEGRNILGMVGSGYMNGQMLLSRAALVKGFSKFHGTENTAIHEFVHLLDKADGATDGIPDALIKHEYVIPWLKMIHQEMHRIEAGKSDISPYALTSEAEFFAVAAEYFFEKPTQLQHKHPEIYRQLSQLFSQDLSSIL